jgi:hypothetical protein
VDEVLSSGVPGLEFAKEGVDGLFEDALVFGTEDAEVADVLAETVFEGVLAGALFASGSLRTAFRGRFAGQGGRGGCEGVGDDDVGFAALDGTGRVALGEDFVAGLGWGPGWRWGFAFGHYDLPAIAGEPFEHESGRRGERLGSEMAGKFLKEKGEMNFG